MTLKTPPNKSVCHGERLKIKLDSMSDLERYKLLATIRTKEPVSEYTKQLRWYFMRLIVARAYTKAYKRPYRPSRDWYGAYDEHWSYMFAAVTSYELEVSRIIELSDHIKNYSLKPNIKIMDGWTRDDTAVVIALRAYYFRFRLYDLTLLMEMKGVSFNEYKFRSSAQPRFNHRQRYGKLVEMDSLLRRANWDVKEALQLWVQEQYEAYQTWLQTNDVPGHHFQKRPPSPARVLAQYARILRHSTTNLVTEAISLDMVIDEDIYHEEPTVLANAVINAYDISVRYQELITESKLLHKQFPESDDRYARRNINISSR